MEKTGVWATGRRKNSVARIWLRPGRGDRVVNGRQALKYFGRDALIMEIEKPFQVTGRGGELDLVASVKGGGVSGQAGAVRLGVARALLKLDPELRLPLRTAALLTRDPRVKERKKYGQPGARKRFQFSKR
jgi:small subunit ribosomal protein S9